MAKEKNEAVSDPKQTITPVIEIKRVGWGWKKGPRSKLVYAIVNKKTHHTLDRTQSDGQYVFDYTPDGLARCKLELDQLKYGSKAS